MIQKYSKDEILLMSVSDAKGFRGRISSIVELLDGNSKLNDLLTTNELGDIKELLELLRAECDGLERTLQRITTEIENIEG